MGTESTEWPPDRQITMAVIGCYIELAGLLIHKGVITLEELEAGFANGQKQFKDRNMDVATGLMERVLTSLKDTYE